MTRAFIPLLTVLALINCGGSTQNVNSLATKPEKVSISVPGIPVTYHPGNSIYTVDLTIDGKVFPNVLIDTGSANLILLGDSQICPNCLLQSVIRDFTPATYTPNGPPLENGQTFSMQYGVGNGTVKLYKATAGFAESSGQIAIDYPLGAYTNGNQVYNILGLGYASEEIGLSGSKPAPFLDAYLAANGLHDIFSINLCPYGKEGSFLTLGSVPSVPTPGPIQYTPIILDSLRHPARHDYYTLAPIALWVSGESAPVSTFPTQDEGYLTIIDSGTTLLYLPRPMLNALATYYQNALGIPPAFWDLSNQSRTTIDGSTFAQLKDLRFEFPAVGGGSFFVDLNPKNYLIAVGSSEDPKYVSGMASSIALNSSGSILGTILGDIFMKSVLVVFDREGEKLGLASNTLICQ